MTVSRSQALLVVVSCALLSALCGAQCPGWTSPGSGPPPPSQGATRTFTGPGGGANEPGAASTRSPSSSVQDGANPVPSSGRTTPATGGIATGPAAATATATPARGRDEGARWSKRPPTALAGVSIPWRPTFLSVSQKPDYAGVTLSLNESARLPADQGGLRRDGLPILVLLFDGSQESHRQAREALDRDARLKSAAHLFACYSIDLRDVDVADRQDLRLRTYLADGTPHGECRGSRGRIPSALEILDRTVEATNPGSFSRAVNWMAESLAARKLAAAALEAARSKLVSGCCAGCDAAAKEHTLAAEALLKAHDDALAAGLAGLFEVR